MVFHITLDARTLVIVAALAVLSAREGLPLDVLTLAFVRVRRELVAEPSDPPRLPRG